ncbi:MAG: hypothetical protein CSA62_05230 [Planctomycetota bacterium]|nr:MAG: hypothetical protein CSA62_05230 [Planctomycetota bacterium]
MSIPWIRYAPSLSRKLLLPMLGFFVVGMISSVIIVRSVLEHDLQSRSIERARALQHAIGFAADMGGSADAFQRFVTAMGSATDVLSIVVVHGDKHRILASSRPGWIGQSIEDLHARGMEQFHELATKSPEEDLAAQYYQFDDNKLQASFAMDSALLRTRNSPASKGFVFLQLDTTLMSHQRMSIAAALLGLGALGIITLTAFMAMLLRRKVILPIQGLVDWSRDPDREQGKPADTRLAAIDPEDEIGALSFSLQSMLQSRKEKTEHLQRTSIELEKARAKAESANSAKSAFLTNMSHEIRTPMTAILGYADLLQDPELASEDRNDYVETIVRNGRHLMTLLDELLDLSKIESGKLSIESILIDPQEILEDIKRLMSARARERDIELDLQLESNSPRAMETDPLRLRQILANLIGNAIKFTERGGVRVRLGKKSGHILVEVEDDGIGISPEKQEKLFEPFAQADESMSRRFGGTGLGLAISRRLAELLGGKLHLKRSAPSEGSCFALELPMGTAEQSVVPKQSPLHRSESQELEQPIGRVLLAEDGIDNQKLISRILQKAGAELTVVDNGRKAVDAALEAREQGRAFDLILMDMQMPVLDGMGAVSELRQQQYLGPIVALTANAMSGDRARYIEGGCDGYEPKPIERKKFLATCRSLSQAGRQA